MQFLRLLVCACLLAGVAGCAAPQTNPNIVVRPPSYTWPESN